VLIPAMSLVILRSCRSLFRHDVARLRRPTGQCFLAKAYRWSIPESWLWSDSPQAVAGKIDAMGVVDEAVEDVGPHKIRLLCASIPSPPPSLWNSARSRPRGAR
jgi:hypothetical protein